MNYVRNAWYVAGWSDQVGDRKPFAITILDEPVVVYRGEGAAGRAGRPLRPPHGAALARAVRGRPPALHVSRVRSFSPEGKVVEIPGREQVPPDAQVRSYPVVERHSWVWCGWARLEKADEALIPPAVGSRSSGLHPRPRPPSTIRLKPRLINDNLLDFSHLSFVHANSFGAGPEFAESQAKISPLERGIRSSAGSRTPAALLRARARCRWTITWATTFAAGRAADDRRDLPRGPAKRLRLRCSRTVAGGWRRDLHQPGGDAADRQDLALLLLLGPAPPAMATRRCATG